MRTLVDELEIEASHADHMAAMAQYWMRRAQEAERTIGVLVHAAGDEIRVHAGHLARSPELVIERDYLPQSMEDRFRTKIVKKPVAT